jgi:hypothetical protein
MRAGGMTALSVALRFLLVFVLTIIIHLKLNSMIAHFRYH